MTGQTRTNWIAWGFLALCGICFLALFLPAYRDVRPAARRTQCLNNLHNIGIALASYASKYGSLPPAYLTDAHGRPTHSWRALILPYLDRGDLTQVYRFDEPWNGPNNSKLHGIDVDVFRCPADGGKKTNTSYVAVVGDSTLWPGAGCMKYEDATDGLGTTLLVVEIADSGIHWMEPRDLELASMPHTINDPAKKGISSRHPGIVAVAFADGRVKVLNAAIPWPTLEALLTARGKEIIPDSSY